MARFCPSCGRNIPNDARICPYCGKTLAMHEGIIKPDQYNAPKKDNVVLIVAVVILILIISTIAIAATVYVYVSGMIGEPHQTTPSIYLVKDSDASTLTVMSILYGGNLQWSDFEISGECDTSDLGIYVLEGDVITECSGTITIIYTDTYSMIGSWTFD